MLKPGAFIRTGIRLLAGLLAVFLIVPESLAAARSRARARPAEATMNVRSEAPTAFAPVAADHPLADLWNDPDFNRRLLGSYGFNSVTEPALSLEEQTLFRETILPVLRLNPTNAIPLLEAALRPDASAVFDQTLGTIHFQHGALTDAVRHFESAVSKFPDYERAWRNLGFARARDGHYAGAIAPLARALELGGADGELLGLLGFAYLSTGRPVPATAALQQALLFKPDHFNLQLHLLQALVASGQYEPAVKQLEELLSADPERANLWVLLGNLHVERNQLADAAVSYEMLRRLGVATAENLLLLGDLYLAQEAVELALGAYLEGVKHDAGKDADRSLRAAEILTGRGAWEEARALFQAIRGAAGESLPDAAGLKLLKLETRVALATGETDSAIETLETIIRRNPLDGEALLLAGDYYAEHGPREKAEFRFDAAGKIEGFEAEAFVKQARLLVRHQEYRRAAELLQKAQQLRPREPVQRYLEQVLKLAAASPARAT